MKNPRPINALSFMVRAVQLLEMITKDLTKPNFLTFM